MSTIDYVLLALVIIISAAIGLYQAWRGVRNSEDFFVAGRQMKFLPVTFSLLASWNSAIGILGVTSETYMYGLQLLYLGIGSNFVLLIVAYYFIPVFYQLQLGSVYQVI